MSTHGNELHEQVAVDLFEKDREGWKIKPSWNDLPNSYARSGATGKHSYRRLADAAITAVRAYDAANMPNDLVILVADEIELACDSIEVTDDDESFYNAHVIADMERVAEKSIAAVRKYDAANPRRVSFELPKGIDIAVLELTYGVSPDGEETSTAKLALRVPMQGSRDRYRYTSLTSRELFCRPQEAVDDIMAQWPAETRK